MLDEEMAILISVILNLVKDGEAELSALPPTLQEYLFGLVTDYESSEEEVRKRIYWFANTRLNEVTKERMLH